MTAGDTKEVAKSEGLTKKSSDPKKDFAAAVTGNPVNVRVGSEAAVDSGTGPVLPVGGSLSEATKVHNKDLRDRDEKELEKRGLGSPLREMISVSFTGLKMVSVDGAKVEPKSGGGTFEVKEKLEIRRPTPEEEVEYGPKQSTSRRAEDRADRNVVARPGVHSKSGV